MTQPPDNQPVPYVVPTNRTPYGQPYPQPQVIIAHGPPTSGMAVASMVLGILGLVSSCCTFGIFSLLAVILGHIALTETKNGQKDGHGMAVAGLVMGYVFFLPAAVFSVWMVLGAGLSAIDPATTTP